MKCNMYLKTKKQYIGSYDKSRYIALLEASDYIPDLYSEGVTPVYFLKSFEK